MGHETPKEVRDEKQPDDYDWIKCSERLPTKDDATEMGVVLTYGYCEGSISKEFNVLRYDLVTNEDFHSYLKITHWMKMPKGPGEN